MATYAKDTSVSVATSRTEIERILARYGATAFGYGSEGNRIVVQFAIAERRVLFNLTVPPRSDFLRTPSTRQLRKPDQVDAAWEKAQRQQWRALVLFVKATLEAVEQGLLTVEQAFLAHILLPDQTTVSDWMCPQLQTVYESGDMPELLPPARGELGR